MRTGAAVLLLLLAVAAAVFWGRKQEPAAPAPPEERPLPEWTGSALCADCHKELYDSWLETGHAVSIRDFSEEAVAKPFDGEVFSARDRDHRLGPGAEMYCEGPGGEMRTYPVEAVVGVRRIQMFLTTLDGGRIQVLPVFLEVQKQRWFDYTDFIFGAPPGFTVPPDSPNSWYHYARNFNSRCGVCHATHYEVGYDANTGVYRSKWSERAIGCEACHGPGGPHVEKWRKLQRGPDPILNPSRMSIERSNQVCGSCHAEAEVIVPGYRPGDDLFAFLDVLGLEDSKHLMPDGRANELIHNLVPIMESRCGPISCTKCHDAHGRGIPGDLYKPIESDWTCTQCHGEIEGHLEEHTRHKATGKGSRCVYCHMPQLVIEGGHGKTYDHTISTPSMVNSQKLGLPNACRSCHALEEIGWECEWFEKWYPGAEQRNHRVALARTMAAARMADPAAKEALGALLKDANPVYRAGAAWALAAYDGVDLRPQLADAHAMVRRAAVKGVAARHPDALVPLLEDANMVLRRAAAFELAEKRIARPFDYIRARPELREKVLAALLGFSKLRPDVARLHFTIGGLHEIAGRKQEAIRSYERYLRLNRHDKKIREHLAKLK